MSDEPFELSRGEAIRVLVEGIEGGVQIQVHGGDGPCVTMPVADAEWLFRTAGPSVLLAIGARPELRGPVAAPPDRG